MSLMAGPALLQQRAVQHWSSLMKSSMSQIHNSSSTLSTIRQGEILIWLLSQIFHSSLNAPYQQWKKGRQKHISYPLDHGREHQATPSAWERRRGIPKDKQENTIWRTREHKVHTGMDMWQHLQKLFCKKYGSQLEVVLALDLSWQLQRQESGRLVYVNCLQPKWNPNQQFYTLSAFKKSNYTKLKTIMSQIISEKEFKQEKCEW